MNETAAPMNEAEPLRNKKTRRMREAATPMTPPESSETKNILPVNKRRQESGSAAAK